MRHIKRFIITFIFVLVGLPLIGALLESFMPGSGIKELFFFFLQTTWRLVRNFALENTVNKYGVFIVISIIFNGLGIYISKKRENFIYEVIALILSIIGLAKGSIL